MLHLQTVISILLDYTWTEVLSVVMFAEATAHVMPYYVYRRQSITQYASNNRMICMKQSIFCQCSYGAYKSKICIQIEDVYGLMSQNSHCV